MAVGNELFLLTAYDQQIEKHSGLSRKQRKDSRFMEAAGITDNEKR